jgi:hypothetical protein
VRPFTAAWMGLNRVVKPGSACEVCVCREVVLSSVLSCGSAVTRGVSRLFSSSWPGIDRWGPRSVARYLRRRKVSLGRREVGARIRGRGAQSKHEGWRTP